MSRPLGEYFFKVISSDVHDFRGTFPGQDHVFDFVGDEILWAESDTRLVSWVITNPPFNQAEAFAKQALANGVSCALLVRTTWQHTVGRYENIFKDTPPSIIAPFAERVPMVKGRLDRKASTATDYCWMVWDYHDLSGKTTTRWIPPCRKDLERPGDYGDA